jgi:uncharacterized cupredoxin-like copper-binding protein
MKHVNIRWFYILAIMLLAVTLACSANLSLGDGFQDDNAENGDNTTIHVLVKDFSFSLEQSQTKAGRITFVVQNNGSMHHDFAVRGDGVKRKSPMIEPGESTTLTVDLEPGTYTYVCTIPGHDQLGMSGAFTVTSN